MLKEPEIIVDIGVNYYDIAAKENLTPFDAACLMIEEARRTGARAVKFQFYKADRLAAAVSPAYWDLEEEPTASQRELFARFDRFGRREYEQLAAFCAGLGIEFMATPFDVDSAAALDPLVSRHKVASADITNSELLEKIGSFRKPVLLSTGASEREEISRAVETLQHAGAAEVALLHCVLNYPTGEEQANLWKIEALRREYPRLRVGYSDHTRFNAEVLVTAWLLGADLIEKHFTLDKTLKGNDHYHAADSRDIGELRERFRIICAMVGAERPQWYDPAEEKARIYARRGVYLVRGVSAGDPLQAADAVFLRPQAKGITPFQWREYLRCGKRYAGNLPEGTLVTAEMLA